MDSLFSTASSFLKGSQETQQQQHHHQGGEGEEEIKEGHEQKQQQGGGQGHSSDNPSYGEVFSSAQVLMGAAMGGGGSGSRPDMGEVAEAAGNILGAVSHYAHLEQSSYGAYVEKAETYLHQYGSKHASGSGEENPNPGHRPGHQGREGESEAPSREDESGQYGDESRPQHKTFGGASAAAGEGGEQGRYSRNEE
jgi:hypothetical protein